MSTADQQDFYAAPGETSQGRVFTVTGQDEVISLQNNYNENSYILSTF